MNLGNQNVQRKLNHDKVLNCLRFHGAMCRSQLAELTKLGWGSITKYSNEMLDKHLIHVRGAQKSAGRDATILGINPSYGFFVGLDIGATHLKGVRVSFDGTLEETWCESTCWNGSRDDVLDQIYSVIERLAPRKLGRLLAIGCGFSGGVDFQRGFVKRAGNFANFDQVPLQELLECRFGVPVFVSNSIIARLISVNTCPEVSGVRNAAFVSVGTGIGAGMICAGDILIPTHDERVGDIAHYMIDRHGPQCYCGLHGCLETYVGGRRFTEKYHLDWQNFTSYEQLPAQTLQAVSQIGHLIAQALAGIIQIYRPTKIIFGGGLTRLQDALLLPMREYIQKMFPTERFDASQIIFLKYDRFYGARGAALYAWDHLYPGERSYVNMSL